MMRYNTVVQSYTSIYLEEMNFNRQRRSYSTVTAAGCFDDHRPRAHPYPDGASEGEITYTLNLNVHFC